MHSLSDDIKFIRSIYQKYNFDSPKPPPSIDDCMDRNVEVLFNNVLIGYKEMEAMTEAFFNKMVYNEIKFIKEVELIDPRNNSFLVLTNWHSKTNEGVAGDSAVLEILTIKDKKVVKAIGNMDMTEIGRFM